MKENPYWTFPSFLLHATPEVGETGGTSDDATSM
jgi:hypothetical protein